MTKEAYPLSWPGGHPRTAPHLRKWGQFGRSMTPGRCLSLLCDEVRRLGARDLIISTNVELRRDGLPYANRRAPADPGVAVYFKRKGKDVAMACDVYDAVHKNMRGLTLAIESLRALERHGGGQMLERAFQGFAALPASIVPARPWWSVLGWDDEAGGGHAGEPASLEDVARAYRARALVCHPDKSGGSADAMRELNNALAEAKAAIGELA